MEHRLVMTAQTPGQCLKHRSPYYYWRGFTKHQPRCSSLYQPVFSEATPNLHLLVGGHLPTHSTITHTHTEPSSRGAAAAAAARTHTTSTTLFLCMCRHSADRGCKHGGGRDGAHQPRPSDPSGDSDG